MGKKILSKKNIDISLKSVKCTYVLKTDVLPKSEAVEFLETVVGSDSFYTFPPVVG